MVRDIEKLSRSEARRLAMQNPLKLEGQFYELRLKYETLREERDLYREALEFYGNENNYDSSGVVIDVMPDHNNDPEFYQDVGARANKALAAGAKIREGK